LIEDTETSSARNTYFDNIHGGPQKVTHCQIIKKSYYISLKPTNEIRFLCQIKASIKHCIMLYVRDQLCDVTNYVWSTSSNMRHIMVNDVSAPSGVSSNDLMMILDSVFLFGHTCINL